VIAHDLTGKPRATHATRSEAFLFGSRHRLWLAFNKFDTARGAAGIPTTGMHDVDVRILFDGQHKPRS
jgi:hypothetical protein